MWYTSWFRNYRVGSYKYGTPAPSWDSPLYEFEQDYCASKALAPYSDLNGSPIASNAAYESSRYWSATRPTEYFVDGDISHATHPQCWGGKKIPLCRSHNMVTSNLLMLRRRCSAAGRQRL